MSSQDSDTLPRPTVEQQQEGRAFCAALEGHDAHAMRRLLESSTFLRQWINAPAFEFGQRAAHKAADDIAMLEVLIEYGADVNLRSDWKNGPYTVLDNAGAEAARFLISHGAVLTPNVAARLGWFDDVRRLVEADPDAVHTRGGDGQQPLHQTATVEIADYLLDHGAGIDVRCIDHLSTPAQYALAGRPDVCRRLLDRGASPDIFMAARLGDGALAERLLRDNPAAATARVNEPGYDAVPPFNIYCWTLGFLMSPHAVARKYGHEGVHNLLLQHSPSRVAFVEAAMRGDEAAALAILDREPGLMEALTPGEHGLLAHAIFHERFEVATTMLRLGFDPAAGGVDGGSALHAAAWMGQVALIDQLLARRAIPIDRRDPKHGSTPLGWAVFGSVHRRAEQGDYIGAIDRLIAAGADVHAPANGDGEPYLGMAEGNALVQEALRRHGVA